jgi:hypothetical protein
VIDAFFRNLSQIPSPSAIDDHVIAAADGGTGSLDPEPPKRGVGV